MILFLYFTSWILIIAIPSTSSLFCFVDYKSATTTIDIDNYIAALLFTISIIPLIVTHLARFLLLRIQHGISNATMSFNLGQITWHQFLDNPEIIVQEYYDISSKTIRKYTIYICLILICISSITIILTHPYNAIWIIAIALGIVSIMTSIIVWIKSKNFNVKSRLDSYGILKEMNQTTIVLIIQFIIYLAVASSFTFYIISDIQCEGIVATHSVLTIGLTIIWIIQLRFALRATLLAHKPLPLPQILSSYDGYKAFLRFLTGELSIENLEFFQLSMRWRYRLCCWLHGIELGTKPPADNIRIPFEIFSFQYVDRLLPQTEGGGLVLNAEEIQEQQQKDLPMLAQKDSTQFFQSLPLSRAGILNTHTNTYSFILNTHKNTSLHTLTLSIKLQLILQIHLIMHQQLPLHILVQWLVHMVVHQ